MYFILLNLILKDNFYDNIILWSTFNICFVSQTMKHQSLSFQLKNMELINISISKVVEFARSSSWFKVVSMFMHEQLYTKMTRPSNRWAESKRNKAKQNKTKTMYIKRMQLWFIMNYCIMSQDCSWALFLSNLSTWGSISLYTPPVPYSHHYIIVISIQSR